MPSTVRPLTSTAAVPRRPEQVGTVVIRPLLPGEEETVQAVFDGLSARSRFLRFHTGLPRLTPAMLRRLADVRDGQHTAYVAVLEG